MRAVSWCAYSLLAAILLSMGLLGCNGSDAPPASISGIDSTQEEPGQGGQTAGPATILKPGSDHSARSPATSEDEGATSLPVEPTYSGGSPFSEPAEADPLPQAALPTTEGPPR